MKKMSGQDLRQMLCLEFGLDGVERALQRKDRLEAKVSRDNSLYSAIVVSNWILTEGTYKNTYVVGVQV